MNAFKHRLLFVAAWLSALILGAVIYLPGLPGAFVFDDIGSISSNPSINLQVLNAHSLLQAMLSAPVGGLLRPISTLSFVLDAYFFGVTPEPFKITNIIVHLMVGVLLWYLARELLRAYRASSGKAIDDRVIAWLSLAISALWLVHPLNLTSVLYTVQRDNSLAALFTVAAILCYLIGRRRGREGKGGRWQIWVLTPLCMLAGLLCKENAALAPVFILVVEFTLLNFNDTNGKPSREIGWFFLVFLVLPLLGAGSLVVLKPGFLFGSYAGRNFTLYERLLSECRIMLDYLRWAIIPDLRQLGLFHDDIAPSRGLLHPITTLPCVLAIAGLLAAGLALRARVPLLSFGILWFFAGQLMESTVLPLELVFEHRNYLPLFGLIVGGVSTFYLTVETRGKTTLATGTILVCLLLLSLTTAMRSADWQNELTYARSESRHHPHSARAQAELEWTYVGYIIATKDTRLIPLALDAAERSKQQDPGSINQDIGLAYMYASLRQLPQSKLHLSAAADEAINASPSATQQLALESLLTMTSTDNQTLFPEMSLIFENAVQNPNFMREACYGAEIWNTFGIFRRKTEDIPGALGAMHRAISMCPINVLMRTNFVDMLLAYGDTKDAALQLDTLKDVHDLRYLPEIQRLEKEYAEAIRMQDKK